jgi:hypothetical protein
MYKVIFNYNNCTLFKYYKKEEKVDRFIRELEEGYELVCVYDMENDEYLDFTESGLISRPKL